MSVRNEAAVAKSGSYVDFPSALFHSYRAWHWRRRLARSGANTLAAAGQPEHCQPGE